MPEFPTRLRFPVRFAIVVVSLLLSGCWLHGFGKGQHITSADEVQSDNTRSTGGINISFVDIVFLSVEKWVGWDVTGKIWLTEDRGASWKPVASLPKITQRSSMMFVSRETGFAMFDEKLWITRDGGQNWAINTDFRVDLISDFEQLDGVFFLDENTGWCVGNRLSNELGLEGIVLKTSDAGTTWERQTIIDAARIATQTGKKWDLRGVWFGDARDGWAAGAGVLIKTTDGGQTWKAADNARGSFEKVEFRRGRTGLLFEKSLDQSLYSNNHGQTWHPIRLEMKPFVGSKIFLTEGGSVVLADASGRIWTRERGSRHFARSVISLDEWNRGLSDRSSGVVYIGQGFDGALVCVWVLRNGNQGLRVIVSRNQGLSWE